MKSLPLTENGNCDQDQLQKALVGCDAAISVARLPGLPIPRRTLGFLMKCALVPKHYRPLPTRSPPQALADPFQRCTVWKQPRPSCHLLPKLKMMATASQTVCQRSSSVESSVYSSFGLVTTEGLP